MAISQKKSLRKVSGGRYKSKITKRLCNSGSLPRYTKLGGTVGRIARVKGANKKVYLLKCDVANIYDKKNKKYVKANILSVIGNPANRHFIRRNILTKGAIIKTEIGDARITSRPGQEGTINAVLI